MSNFRKLIGWVIVIFSLSNCSADTSRQRVDQDTLMPEYKISIDLDKAMPSKSILSDSSTQWLNLSISNTYRVHMTESRLFILNILSQGSEFKVYDFKLRRQVFSIDDINVTDFSVDYTSKEILLLTNRKNINVINFEGEFIRQLQLSKEVSEIRKLSADKLIGYDNYRDMGEASFYIFDSRSGNDLAQYLPFGKQARGLARMVNTSLTRNTDAVYAAPFLSNLIYILKKDSIEKWIQLDFGKHNSNFQEFVTRKDEAPFMVAMQNNWVYSIDRIIESDNSLACVIIKGGKPIQLIFNKNNPMNWCFSMDHIYDASIRNTLVSVIPDKDSVTIENGEVLTKRIKLAFFNPKF